MSMPINNPLVLTTFYKKVSFQVKIDKHLFSLGETIHVEAEVENKGQDSFVHHGSSTCDDTIYFAIQTKDEHYLIGEGSVYPKPCTRDYREFHLNPNQKINQSADFQTKRIDEQPVEVGEYILTAKYGDIRFTIPIQIQ